ncbi:hypothetical protein WSM22_35660 [Cytophagales bacterium WSM2-2]|nr:hypothetical protein WSM22_35660 [Cytophagales bacterium WSM2-2]
MTRLPLVLGLLLPLVCSAQSVKIKRVELAKEKVIVHYDLDDSNPNNEYQLNLYASKDNYTVPMTKVRGDVGNEIKPGTNKKIEWNINDELGDYEGELALEVRGKVFVMFAKLQGFETDKSYKRGKTYELNWKPGNTNPIHIELLKGSERMVGELNHPNNGTYLLTMPANAKPGDDYRIRITDSKRPDESIYTGFFTLKHRIPIVLKAIGGAVVLGGLVAGGSSLAGGSKEAGSQPNPPALPGN